MIVRRRLVGVLIALAIVSIGVGVDLVLVDAVLAPGRTALESPAPVPSATLVAHQLMAVPIPADADCDACHVGGGGREGLEAIPPMAHAVEGWRNCTACHADASLVQTAPGHTGIGKELCLACHAPASPGASALPRPHHVVTGTSCINCHGSTAPLPTDMAGRTNCWICHPDPDSERLFGTPAPTASD